jgi:signal transduction histidine kinase
MAVQLKVFGNIFTQHLGIHDKYTIFLAGIIVVMYSAFGGMRSVAFTDVIQFFTFGVLIPVLSVVLWNEYVDINGFNFGNATHSPLFDYREFIGLDNSNFWSLALLFVVFLNPGFHPSLFQKITMGKNVAQVKDAFTISAVLLFLILAGVCWIGFLLFNVNPNLDPDNLVHYIIENYSHPGLKGFILIGIVAMCMSNADTNLNSATVILIHDFCTPLGIKYKSELFLSKVIAITLGSTAMLLASLDYDLLSLIFLVFCFNLPLIQPPLLLAILGWRTTERCVLIGMAAGFIGLIAWAYIIDTTLQNSLFPAMIANTIALMSSHYILKQPGGWVGIKDTTYLRQLSFDRKRKWQNLCLAIKNFNLINFCKKNAPRSELTYSGFGIFSLIATVCTMYSTSGTTIVDKNVLLFFYETMLILSVSFITYPIWPQVLKKELPVKIVWNFSVLYILIICSTFFLMVSNFNQAQVMISMVSLIVVGTLMRWQAALVFIMLGVFTAIQFYQHYIGLKAPSANIISLELQIVYLLLLVGSMLIMFFKPRQEREELTEAQKEHLGERVHDNEEELQKLLALKNEFLRNLSHELHTPITGITSMAGAILANEKNMTKAELVENIRVIAQSSDRFETYTNGLLDLSKLSSLNFELDRRQINLSALLVERIDACIKMYLDGKNLEFIKEIEPNIILNCDKRYMQPVFDNLIINAINYSKIGKITIKLKKHEDRVEFEIKDGGIGINPKELFDIFEAFTVSSKTRTPASGRGIGLAICKKSIEAHGGKIWAESNGKKGAIFKFEI